MLGALGVLLHLILKQLHELRFFPSLNLSVGRLGSKLILLNWQIWNLNLSPDSRGPLNYQVRQFSNYVLLLTKFLFEFKLNIYN